MCRAFTNKMHILYTVGRPLSQDVFVLFSFRSLGYRLNAQLLQYQSNMSTMLYKTCRMSRRPRVYFFRSLSSLGIILTFQCRPWSLRGPNEKETPWSPFTLALKPQLGRKFSLRSYWLSFLSRSSLERSPPSPRPKWSVCSGRGLESKYGALTGVHNLGISELIEWQDRGNLHLINGFFSDYIIQFLAIGSDSNERGSVLCPALKYFKPPLSWPHPTTVLSLRPLSLLSLTRFFWDDFRKLGQTCPFLAIPPSLPSTLSRSLFSWRRSLLSASQRLLTAWRIWGLSCSVAHPPLRAHQLYLLYLTLTWEMLGFLLTAW